MKNALRLPIPVKRALRKIGIDIYDARRRRRIPTAIMAERAGISRATLGKIEKGEATVSMGAYATVLFCLGMVRHLNDIIDPSRDLVGQRLDEERLPKRIHLPKE